MTRPTQHEISAWAVETFGDNGTDLRCVARMNEEIAELLTAATSGAAPDKIASECADVFICAARLAVRLDANLEAELAVRPVIACASAEHGAIMIVPLVGQILVTLLVRGSEPSGKARAGFILGSLVACLRDICVTIGCDFDAAVTAKMEINRARLWVLDGTGCGRHVT